jgi:hypothetical protein
MEKVNSGGLYVYGFSKAEAFDIRDTLSAYDTKAVIGFLMDAERVCTRQLSIMDAPLTRPDMDVEKKKMVGHFEKAKADIEILLDNKIKLVPTEKVNELPLENMTDVELYERYRQRLLTAFYALEEVSNFVAASITQKRQGRPPVDNTDFVKSIADCYRLYIDKPTTYRDGPFFFVVQIILKAVNLPGEDPSRAIQAALK